MGAVKELVLEMESKGYTKQEVEKYFEKKNLEVIWDRDGIQRLLENSEKAVIRGLLVVFNNQTIEEQRIEGTVEHNKKGFSGPDAEILTSFAKQYLEKGYLTPKQFAIARERMKKYWKQLLKEAEKRCRRVTYRT